MVGVEEVGNTQPGLNGLTGDFTTEVHVWDLIISLSFINMLEVW